MRRVEHSSPGLPVSVRGARLRTGFTLIELLVVISIVALLIGILLPSLKRSMELAKGTACKSNLRQLGNSLLLYRIENDGWLPPSQMVDPRGSTASANGGRRERPKREPWFGQLFPTYLADPVALRCPKDPFGFRVQNFGNRPDWRVADLSSYGINSFILEASDTLGLNVDRRPPTRPADTMLVADLGPDREGRARTGAVALASAGPERNSSLLAWSDGFDVFARDRRDPWVTQRHDHGIHVATLTGEVRSVRTTRVLKQPVEAQYPSCRAGGCTFCLELNVNHYSFAEDRLFWWTGPLLPPQQQQ